jgi:hypothetical protein
VSLQPRKRVKPCKFVEKLIKKEEGMISGFLEERGVFLFLAGCPLLFPYSFYILENLVPFYKIVIP